MSDIHASLGETEYGQTLSDNVRFGRFKPDEIPNQEWIEALGPDVDNYKHMEYTANLAAWYIYEADRLGVPLSEEDQKLLILTAYVHDFAEAIDGDVPDPYKDHSDDAKAKEKRSFITVARTVVEDPEALGALVFPVMYGGSPLARDFRAIEIIGYAETAKQAGKVTGEAYGKLYDEVLPNSLAMLEEYKDLKVVNNYLKEQ